MARRIVAAKIKHETNGFNRVPTTLDDFRAYELHWGPGVADYYRGTRLEMGAFLDAAERNGWSVSYPVAAFANPSGIVADDAFEALVGRLIDGLKAETRIDGILLALHGSMFTASLDDAEGEILARVRAVVGPSVPIAVTLDPHANVTRKMVEHADILTAFRTSPHTDQYATGERAARLLQQVMDGALRPVRYFARRPMVQGFDGARTYRADSPMRVALARAERWEREVPDVACVSIAAGYSRCDVAEFGPTVTIMANGEHPEFQQYAESLMDYCWETRRVASDPLVSIEAAVQAAQAHPAGAAPLVLGDYGDAPGGGSYGDSTRLLAALIAGGVRNGALAAIWDPATARQAVEAGAGARLQVALGGHTDPYWMGDPIRAEATVKAVSADGDVVFTGPYGTGTRRSFGPSACLEVAGFDVIVASMNVGIYDLEQFRKYGVDPATKSVVVVKCMQGHHAAFDPIASATLDVDTGGLTGADLSRFTYTRVPRPVWPLDAMD
jgi:microcystin degradation protein MlrC